MDSCSNGGLTDSSSKPLADVFSGAYKCVVVGEKLANSSDLKAAVQKYPWEVLFSDLPSAINYSKEPNTVFILDSFDLCKGSTFYYLHQCRAIITGPALVLKNWDGKLPDVKKPLYSRSMNGVVLAFSENMHKNDLARLAKLAHFLGALVKPGVSEKVTHLVIWRPGCESYKLAMALGKVIVNSDWLHHCWSSRDDIDFDPTNENVIKQFQWKPFRFCSLSFYGFSDDEMASIEELTLSNEGKTVAAGSNEATHLVVSDEVLSLGGLHVPANTAVVTSAWFWACIQMELCASEELYQTSLSFSSEDKENSASSKVTRSAAAVTPSCSTKLSRNRKFQQNLAQLALEGDAIGRVLCPGSSESGAVPLNSGSSSHLESGKEDLNLSSKLKHSSPNTKYTPRQQTILELYQTEVNYVSILEVIVELFKERIEKLDQPGGPILEPQESKVIFGGIPPILELHLEIKNEILEITKNIHKEHLVGRVFTRHADKFKKCYPKFVNFFENIKDSIEALSKSKPRFQAFLKLSQQNRRCVRQKLIDLMIRPVQRLPSIMLLLKDIHKRTSDAHEDKNLLFEAIKSLEEIMTEINEGKRKTEGHQTLFSIQSRIENCPADVVSANRSFLCEVICVTVNDAVNKKGSCVKIFVFDDMLEIAKFRQKAQGNKKTYKHLEMVPFVTIKRLVDIADVQNCKHMFGLVTKKFNEMDRHFLAFSLQDSTTCKKDFLDKLSHYICTAMFRGGHEALIARCNASDLNIDVSQGIFNTNSLTRLGQRLSKQVSKGKSTPASISKGTFSAVTQEGLAAQKSSAQTTTLHRQEGLAGSADVESSMRSLGSTMSIDSSIFEVTRDNNITNFDTQSCNLDETVVDTFNKRLEKKPGFAESLENIGNFGGYGSMRTPTKNREQTQELSSSQSLAKPEKRWFSPFSSLKKLRSRRKSKGDPRQ